MLRAFHSIQPFAPAWSAAEIRTRLSLPANWRRRTRNPGTPAATAAGVCALERALERLIDDLVGMSERTAVARNTELKSRRVQHQGKIVDMRQDCRKCLTHARIIGIRADAADDEMSTQHKRHAP